MFLSAAFYNFSFLEVQSGRFKGMRGLVANALAPYAVKRDSE